MSGIMLNNEKIKCIHKIYNRIKLCEVKHNGKFKICPDCKGTGLSGYSKLQNGGYLWTGEYCYECGGIGRLPSNINYVIFICDKCNGSGLYKNNICDKCEGDGLIDWIRRCTKR